MRWSWWLTAARCWRAAGPVIQRASPVRAAILPSRVMAYLTVTKGRPVVIRTFDLGDIVGAEGQREDVRRSHHRPRQGTSERRLACSTRTGEEIGMRDPIGHEQRLAHDLDVEHAQRYELHAGHQARAAVDAAEVVRQRSADVELRERRHPGRAAENARHHADRGDRHRESRNPEAEGEPRRGAPGAEGDDARAARVVELRPELGLVDLLGELDAGLPVDQREGGIDLGVEAPDHLQHQELVEIGVEQAPDDRIELPGVVVDPGRDVDHQPRLAR